MRWTEEQAWKWFRSWPWLCGFNYIPSTAVNSTEMWQQESFDLPTIERELDWAAAIGFNCCRVFLQYLLWEDEGPEYFDRVGQFIAIANRRGLLTLPVLFDDCAFAGKEPHLGPQDAPRPGVHNSSWTPSPGRERVRNPREWPGLEDYVLTAISHFAGDARILAWDLYNEPGNGGVDQESQPLLKKVFRWAREAGPSQPLTTGIWSPELLEINTLVQQESDVISFHDYNDLPSLQNQVEGLRGLGRPLLCTEWMRREVDSQFESHLPFFREQGIGCFFWGLVNGRTQTHFPWGSTANAAAPEVWFHDLLHSDGTPYNPDEVLFIRNTIAASRDPDGVI